MTTDTIQDAQIRILKARNARSMSLRRNTSASEKGIELTRLQDFIDGGHDIFDILEQHAANTQMKIRAPRKKTLPDDLHNSNLFTSLLKRLREQMREMV